MIETIRHRIGRPCLVSVTFILASLMLLLATSRNMSSLPNRLPKYPSDHRYTYIGSDYPPTWPLPALEPVYLSLENSVHYAFDTPLGSAEWNATLPSGGAILHLGHSTFTLGMLHQVRCLNIVREVLAEFYADQSPDAKIRRPGLARHCMNYLRQMVLCNADLRLESVRAPHGNQVTEPEVTHTCRDWNAVYEAAEKNYQVYMEGSQSH